MANDLVCQNCGGTEFYKESGYFYCNECQIQSQEVQEHVFDTQDDKLRGTTHTKVSKKTESGRKKSENKITSWECYNHILLGLTQELIELGAQPSYKTVMKTLWMRYLEKLQVFSSKSDGPPKLQAVNSKMDSEIIYGKVKKRKRSHARSSSDESLRSATSSTSRGALTRKKKALVKIHYDDLNQKSQDLSSLHNETLTSLKTSSEKSSKKTSITYNVYATRELRKKVSSYHWREHRNDFSCDLNCHRVGYRKISNKYRTGPYILSLNKIYALLYVGLLINCEKIQLGDLLRFIDEGRVSFNYYEHFFPDDFADRVVNFRNFKKNTPFTHSNLREVAAKLACFLKLTEFIHRPDLVELSRRYCVELNLPREIHEFVKIFLFRFGVNMKFRRRDAKIHNYEGRVLSVILFILKLNYSFDDVTELRLSTFASILNQSKSVKQKSFNLIEWLRFLEYREIILRNHHFPTNYAKEKSPENLELYVEFISQRNYENSNFNKQQDDYNQLLKRLKSRLPQFNTTDRFESSLTPFKTYLETVKIDDRCLRDVIDRDFSHDSLDFILKPNKFLKAVGCGNFEVRKIHGGANENWVFEKVTCPSKDYAKRIKKQRELVTVKLTTKQSTNHELLTDTIGGSHGEEVDIFKKDFYSCHKANFRSNVSRIERLSKKIDLDIGKVSAELEDLSESYREHFQPYERLWTRVRPGLTRKNFLEFFAQFPANFKLVFDELSRICHQSCYDFFQEYQLTEIYLIYFIIDEKKCGPIDKNLKRLIESACDLW